MHKKAYKEGLTMKKWYRKTVTRTIVLVVAILSGALLVTNLLSLLTLAWNEFVTDSKDEYTVF